MRYTTWLGLIFVLVLHGSYAMASPLDTLRWEQRVLLLFGSDAALEAQRDDLSAERSGLEERRLLVLRITDDVAVVAGRTPATLPTAGQLRRSYDVAPDARFTVVLVGLDGGEKWRGTTPVAPQRIFAIIDAMPMRRAGSN